MYYTYEFRQNAAEIEIDHRMMFGRMDDFLSVLSVQRFRSIQFSSLVSKYYGVCVCVCI